MTTPNVITASLPRTPEETLAPGVLQQYLPVTFAEKVVRFKGDGEFEAGISLDVAWVYPELSGSGDLQIYAGGPIIPVTVDFWGEGFLQTEEMTIPKVFADLGAEGSLTATRVIGKKSFSDDFNRANGAIGANYVVPLAGEPQPTIVSNIAQSPVVSGTALIPALFKDPMTTDSMSAVMVVAAPNSTAQSELYVRASRAGSLIGSTANQSRPNYAIVGAIFGQKLGIYSINNKTMTERAVKTSGVNLVAGDVIELRVSGSTVRMFLNGAEQLNWSDPGGQSLMGAEYRYCGFCTIYSSNAHMTRFDAFSCADL